ncbi:hypothetical protein ACSMXN_08410 [Jatrophihabitans sp. DSM 45814]
MTQSSTEQSVEITDQGQPLAAAQVSTYAEPHATARVSFQAEAGHLPTGTRASLVDAVLDLPEVHASEHLQASVPIGDAESLGRLRERTTKMHSHAAGCTALIDAELAEPCACPSPR